MNTSLRRSFRIVASAPHVSLVKDLLLAQGFVFEPEPFSPLAWRLLEEPFPLGRSLAAFFGYIYIQDRSSMLPPLALNPTQGSFVLDMCSSPGSKTGLLAQLVGTQGLVLGNEPSPSRLSNLRRNLQQRNLFQAITCCHSGEELPLAPASCAHIMLDPPCSGWGTTDRHPSILKLWKGDKVLPLIRLQQNLLKHAAELLQPGGCLVYSTCTTNVDENEAQVHFAHEELGLRTVPLQPFEGFTFMDSARPDVDAILRIDGKASEAQGFFVAAFTKDALSLVNNSTLATGNAGSWTPLAPELLAESGIDHALLPAGPAGIFGDTVHVLPQMALDTLSPRIRWQGAVLGKYASGKFRPVSRLHKSLRTDAMPNIPRLDVDTIEPLLDLTQGRNLQTTYAGKFARLFWRELPLGLLTLKSGRAMWSER